MARIHPISRTQLIIDLSLLFSLLALVLVVGSAEDGLVRTTTDQKLSSLREEKFSHLRFYWHEIYNGLNGTAVEILEPPVPSSPYRFGAISMFDNPMTEGPELSSKLLGRAEGFYGRASRQEDSLIMAMNLHFTQGKYNGSTLTILTRNPYPHTHREVPVVGGTGHFRFARGYALLKTYKSVIFNETDSVDVVEYNVYVFHYDQYYDIDAF